MPREGLHNTEETMQETRLTELIPADQAMTLIKILAECSDYCRSTHPGRLLCPQWRPGEEVQP